MPTYGRPHRREKQRWTPKVKTGKVRCARGAQCRRAVDGVAAFIHPDEEWDLDHDPRDPSRYIGPSHMACNRATRAHMPPRRRPLERHPGLID